MYCGRLDEAREYAERGVLEEPGYPWIWLQTAKLRAHFGDAKGALDAIARGLEIVPEDYEFRVLKEEVDAGLDLDSFEYHWIDPGADAVLQAGEDPNAEAKRLTIGCILTDPEGAERFRTMFDPVEGTWQEDAPYCSFETMSDGVLVEVVFRTNTAAVSKFDASWMSELKARIRSGKWNNLARMMRERDPLFRGQGTLKSVLVDGDRAVTLVYGLPSGRMEEVTLDEGWEPVRNPTEPREPRSGIVHPPEPEPLIKNQTSRRTLQLTLENAVQRCRRCVQLLAEEIDSKFKIGKILPDQHQGIVDDPQIFIRAEIISRGIRKDLQCNRDFDSRMERRVVVHQRIQTAEQSLRIRMPRNLMAGVAVGKQNRLCKRTAERQPAEYAHIRCRSVPQVLTGQRKADMVAFRQNAPGTVIEFHRSRKNP